MGSGYTANLNATGNVSFDFSNFLDDLQYLDLELHEWEDKSVPQISSKVLGYGVGLVISDVPVICDFKVTQNQDLQCATIW